MKTILGKNDKGAYFKLSHFLVLVYRIAIVSFHFGRSQEFLNEYEGLNLDKNEGMEEMGSSKNFTLTNIRKLLYFLRQIETQVISQSLNMRNQNLSESMKYRNWGYGDYMTKNMTLIPPNKLLKKY